MTSEQFESLKKDLELVNARLEILKKNIEGLYEILDQILWLAKKRVERPGEGAARGQKIIGSNR